MNGRSHADQARILRGAANVLRRDEALIRRLFHEKFDAADPVPGVPEMQRLAAVLEAAAELPTAERDAGIRTGVRAEDMGSIRRLADSLAGPSLHTDAAELNDRAEAVSILRDAHALLREIKGHASSG